MASDLHNAKPYALDVKHSRYGSEGMTFAKSVGEKIDDAFDASGNPRWKIIHTPEKDMMVLWNMGENCTSLQKLLGLSSVISRKTPDKIGLMNRGSFAAICHWEPDNLLLVSRNEDGKKIELTFPFGKYLAALDTCHDNYRDPSLDPKKYLECSKLSIETDTYLKEITLAISDSVLKKEFDSISKQAPQFFGAILEFHKGHRLYGNLDREFEACLSTMNLYHGKILKSRVGSAISFENSLGVKKNLDAKTAIDLFYGTSCVHAYVEVRSSTKGTVREDIFEVTLSIDSSEETFTYYITNKPRDDRFKNAQCLYDTPAYYDEMTLIGDLHVRFGCLSIVEDRKQRKQIGGGYESNTELLRGAMVAWNNRYLGEPWWPETPPQRKAIWGAKCNSGPIRMEVDVKDSHEVIKMVNIRTDKGVIDLHDAHPNILHLLDGFMVLAKTFSSSNKTPAQKEDDNWKPTWNAEKTFDLISGKEKPKKVKKTPSEKPATIPNGIIAQLGALKTTVSAAPVVTTPAVVAPAVVTPAVVSAPAEDIPSVTVPVLQNTVETPTLPIKIEVQAHRKGVVSGAELLAELDRIYNWADNRAEYTDTETIEFFNRLRKFNQQRA